MIAVGGNAILKPDQPWSAKRQLDNIKTTCKQLGKIIIKDGYQVVLTYGNGPQVGNILLQNEIAKDRVSPMPLDICGAQSQGLLGYLLSKELRGVLEENGLQDFRVISVITQTLVSSDDPAFTNPTKPIGPFYSRKKAERLKKERGYQITQDANRGWRRVVPSPDPITIMESPVIKHLVGQKVIVIASGGGGVPVAKENGRLRGKEAVIDKDLAACKLACDIKARLLLILTDVQQVMLDYGTSKARGIDRMNREEARKYLDEGHFAAGSMKPKVKACIKFVENGGQKAIITSLDKAIQGLSGKAGTTIY